MNYDGVHPSELSRTQGLQQVRPPQVLISDHSSGVPLGPYHSSAISMSPYHSPGGIPYVPLIPVAIEPTTIPCTTPASVLPPSPPILSPQLPHVFVSDHSEVPALVEPRTLPTLDTKVNAPPSGGRSEGKSVTIAVRRASEPADLLMSSSLTESRSEFDTKDSPRVLQRYQSTTPRSNKWLKRVAALLVCSLVVGLIYKISVELWNSSYGEDNATT